MKNALENFRLETGLTFAAMAKAAGLRSRSTVYQHCKGVRKISAGSALRYCKAFKIPLSALLPDLDLSELGGELTHEAEGNG